MCCNKRWVMAAALCGALVASVHAANVTLTWDATQTPATLGDPATGTLAFTYDADNKIKTLTATPVGGGTIVLTGDTLTANSDSHFVMAAGGELVFSNKVESSWNITAENTVTNTATVTDARTISYSGSNIGTSYTKIFLNRRLEDWMPLTTGNSGSKGWWANASSDNIPTYNIRWEADGSLTAQRQASLGKISDAYGQGVGIVKFQLKQDGDDIAGRAIYAGYWSQTKGPLGTDSDVVFADPKQYNVINQGVTEPTASTGYGINKITLSRVRGLPTVRFAGELSLGGVLFAHTYTHVIYERAKTGSVAYGYQADANGILTFRDPEVNFDPSCNAARNAALGYGIKGAGTVEFEATDALYGDETYDMTSVTSAPWIPTNWVTVAEDKSLACLTQATAIFGGASIGGAYKTRVPIQVLSISPDGQTATGQFQQLGSYNAGQTNRIVGVLVEFRQQGGDVQMQATGAAYFNGTGYMDLYGKDISQYKGNGGVGVTVDSTKGSYGIHDVTLTFASKPIKTVTMSRYEGIRAMAGSTTVPGCKAQVIVRGTDKTVMRYAPAASDVHVLPYTDGLLRVQQGGEVVQLTSGMDSQKSMWVEDRALVRIEKDGVFRQQSAWGVGITQRVELAEGEFRVYDNSAIIMGQCKLNLMTFSGNARLCSARGGADDYVRAGYKQDSVWAVRGTAASQCDVGLNLWADATTGNTMTFAVNDVTESAASDFIMNGGLGVNPDYANVTVFKTGAGTIEFNKSVNLRGCPLVLKGGTWLVNSATTTQATDPVTLDGGTLATAKAGTGLGVLTVGETGGGIALGEGATLSFADSSAATWTGTEKVVITGFAEKSIRFGTSAQALTGVQLNRLRTSEGKRLYMDDDGYLTRESGMAIFIR